MITRLLLVIAAATSLGAQSIQYFEARKVWLLTTRQSSYAIGLGPKARCTISTGARRCGAPKISPRRLPAATFFLRSRPDDRGRRVPGLGRPRYYEPALKITRDDGNRDLVLTICLPPHQQERSRYRPEGSS